MTEDLLDNESITNHEAEITLDHGPSFTPRMRMFAIIFLIGALGMYASGGAGYIIGTGLLLGGIFVISSRHGTQISLKTNYVRAYHDRFFVKSGKWLPIAAFSDICILKISKTLTTSDLTGAVSTSMDVSKNEVFLMTHDHRKRFLLKNLQII